jgi:hypothetical protein
VKSYTVELKMVSYSMVTVQAENKLLAGDIALDGACVTVFSDPETTVDRVYEEEPEETDDEKCEDVLEDL